ncbi:hypothetical protein CC78DRAFT_604874 [Lojkania enalia]|uniref:Ankyrin repeat protein n=1 Tax=Lojkania enalia TaxID=147567 RepID=A0A9P4MYY9_9PLEO|nr:hypothetical protein CC78DRAFT_604874 [Didymosphaeria enalia]
MTTVNFQIGCIEEHIYTRYLRLLAVENYVDFYSSGEYVDCALGIALFGSNEACADIDFLSSHGCNIRRVMWRGFTALHYAAFSSITADSLKHFYNNYGIRGVNTHNQWGWTFLHLVLLSMYYVGRSNNEVVGFLLGTGADAHIEWDENQAFIGNLDGYTICMIPQEMVRVGFEIIQEDYGSGTFLEKHDDDEHEDNEHEDFFDALEDIA